MPLLVFAIILLFGGVFYLFWTNRTTVEEDLIIRKGIRFPQRGIITDRHGKLLVYNETLYDLMVTPSNVINLDTNKVCTYLGISKRAFKKRIRKAKAVSALRASAFERLIPESEMVVIRTMLPSWPGFSERVRVIRRYPDSVAAHLLGFMNTISPQARKDVYGYSRPGEVAGKAGLEKVYDSLLRGKRGIIYYLTDSTGRHKGSFANGEHDDPALHGQRLSLGIDLGLQKFAAELMKNKVGSVVAIDPATGEILAYLSSPGVDPNLLAGPETSANLRKFRSDSLYPLANRPIRGRNAPGSSLKPVIALIALQQGIIQPNDVFFCPQYFMAGHRRVNCEHFDGRVNLRKGIAQSCNTYFCNVFEKQISANPEGTPAAYEDWRQSLSLFGLGAKLGIDLPYELPGQVPPAALYDKVNGKNNWTANNIISLGIGQGELEVTPLQLANIQCIIGNRGFYFTPHLLRTAGGKKVLRSEWNDKHVVPIAAAHFLPVIDGMQDAVENGTAAGIRIPGIPFCGKTGTVQNTKGKSHSIFAGFAPRDHPKIAIAVVVENSGYGASYAAPIASYLFEKYLTGKVTKPAEQVKWMIEQNFLPGQKQSISEAPAIH